MVNKRTISMASAAAVSRLVLVTLVTSNLLSPIVADAFHKLPPASLSASALSMQRFGIRHIGSHNLQGSDSNVNINVLHIRGGSAEEQADTEVQASASSEEEVIDSSGPTPSINHAMELEAEDISDDTDTDEYDYESEYDSQEDKEAGDMSGSVSVSDHGDDLRNTATSTIGVEVMIQEETICIEREQDLTEINVANAQENASQLRIKGKEFHDAGDFDNASETFQKAAIELEGIISTLKVSTNMHFDIELSKELTEERATCRLHEALCHLKNKKYAESIASCTSVLMDGVEVIVVDSSDDEDDDGYDVDSSAEDEGSEQSQSKSSIVRINARDDDSASSDIAQLSPAVKARAYHRRAKARLALGDTAGALDDSRSAAFLGDRNAVALYGRLMRESGGAGGGSPFDGGSGMNGLFGSSSSSPFDSIFSGGSPFSEGSSDSPLGSGSMGLLSSLLSSPGSSEGSSGQSAIPFNPLSMLAGMNGSNSDGGGMGGLAKSVLSSVAKKADDKDMQETVCKYLNALDTSQILSLSSMAGMPLSQSAAERIVSFANGVTPRGIGRSVKLTKRILFVGALMRKIFKIIGKYRHLLVLVVLIGWTKSAIQRPIVIKTVAKKAVEATTSKSAFFI